MDDQENQENQENQEKKESQENEENQENQENQDNEEKKEGQENKENQENQENQESPENKEPDPDTSEKTSGAQDVTETSEKTSGAHEVTETSKKTSGAHEVTETSEKTSGAHGVTDTSGKTPGGHGVTHTSGKTTGTHELTPEKQDDDTHLEEEVSKKMSEQSRSADDLGEEDVGVYEWEQELEEYDEPDIYPSEKDYIMVAELVEIEEEIVEEPVPDISAAEPPPPPSQPQEEAKEEPKEGEAPAEETAEKTEKPEEAQGEKPAEKAPETIEEKEEEEEGDVPEHAEEQEPEKEPEPPKKKYKTVMVRKLVERPPKIHYTPEEERHTHTCSDKQFYAYEPFRLCESFGYDSQRMANLHVLDESTLVYMSGFVLTFFNHVTREKSYLRCIGGSCFGALAVHPSKKLFAAAEKGTPPLIGIWSWPKLQLFRKLQEGTTRTYASVNFNPNGRMLASQGGEPDYLITVWNWLAEMPVLRVKSHAQDVYRVTFSRELAGRLTTSGLCHIKFWKMADTFTGLKLKGDLGRFGRTELSDIEGYVEMPDGKVLSGSEWGNLLVWENGLMVAELCIRSDVPCHEGIVRQVLFNEGEFYTTGQDGWVKTWNFDAVDTAEIHTTEESLKVPLKVVAQTQVGENVDIWSIVPDITPAEEDSTSVFWFAQDGKGSIWKVDLSFLNTAKEAQVISTAHGGPVVSGQFSMTNCLFATLGLDGQVRVYNYITRKLVARCSFTSPGSCLMWPYSVDPQCATILLGFADGTFRVVTLSGEPSDRDNLPMSLYLEHAKKPHGKKLTTMDVHKDGKFLVTGGEDGTIFFFDVSRDYLPMAFVDMPDWKPVRIVQWSKYLEENTVFAALDGGTIVEVQMPTWEEIDNEITYHFSSAKMLSRIDFQSIKSELRHNEELERERLAEEARQDALEEENRKRIDDGVETQSEQDLRLLHEAEELEKLKAEEKPQPKWEPYIPPEASPFLLMILSVFETNEMYLSLDKYDTGYLYLVKLERKGKESLSFENPREPIDAIPVLDSDDVPVTAFKLSVDGTQAFFGFEDGRIRHQTLMFPYDLEHVGAHWTEGIHDCVRGSITAIDLDMSGAFMLTCGNDGNCFLHALIPEKETAKYISETRMRELPKRQRRLDVQDIIEEDAYTLETFKAVEKEMAELATAKRNKNAKREEIARLRLIFIDVLRRNHELPKEVRLTATELAITFDDQSRKEEEYNKKLEQLKFETAWDTEKCNLALNKMKSFYKDTIDCELFCIKSFTSKSEVYSYRLPKFPPFFEEAKDKILHQSTPVQDGSEDAEDDTSSVSSQVFELEPRPRRMKGMDKFVHQRLVRLWERKQKKIQRHRVWKDFMASEPKGKELREEDKAIDDAINTIGDMKLKTAKDYKVPEDKKLTVHRARKRLVYLEEIMYALKEEFNNKMFDLRKQKIAAIARINGYRSHILERQNKLPAEEVMAIPPIAEMTMSENPLKYMDYTPEDIKLYQKSIAEKAKVTTQQTAAPTKPTKAEPVKRRQQQQQQQQQQSDASAVLRKTSSIAKQPHAMASSSAPRDEGADLGSFVEKIHCEPSPLQKQIARIELEEARHYQRYYIKKIQDEQFIFDARLKLLRHRKMKLDYLLKIADERVVTLTEEFLLAQKSEALEEEMEMKITEANKEKRECGQAIKGLLRKLDAAKKELEVFAKQKNALLQEVHAIGTKAPGFERYLVRVFNKKITKPKVKARRATSTESGTSGIGSDDEDSESDSDMDMMDLEDEDDDFDVDLPPPELNKEIYDSVIEIRGRRLAIDDMELESKEVYDELNNNINGFKSRSNNADKSLDYARNELEAFAREKQQHLNNLDCSVSLNLHQMLHLDKNLAETLVTENMTIKRLHRRIPELRKERKAQRKKGLEIKKMHKQLQVEKVKFEERLEEMSKKCDVEMAKKFGVVISVEELEHFSIDPQIIALRKTLAAIEAKNIEELARLDEEHKRMEARNLKETNNQTERFFAQADMLRSVNAMTKQLNDDMKFLPTEYEDTSVKKQVAFLTGLVTEQWKSLNALNLEIARMSRVRPQRPTLPPIRKPYDERTAPF